MKLIELFEEVSRSDLEKITEVANGLWNELGIEIAFTYHFLDRVNERGIEAAELARMFIKQYEQNGKKIDTMTKQGGRVDPEAVMVDLFTKVNLPFVLKDKGPEKKKVLVGITALKGKKFNPKPQDKVFYINK